MLLTANMQRKAFAVGGKHAEEKGLLLLANRQRKSFAVGGKQTCRRKGFAVVGKQAKKKLFSISSLSSSLYL